MRGHNRLDMWPHDGQSEDMRKQQTEKPKPSFDEFVAAISERRIRKLSRRCARLVLALKHDGEDGAARLIEAAAQAAVENIRRGEVNS